MTATCVTAAATLAACGAARRRLSRRAPRKGEYLGGAVRLTEHWNTGAAFGLPIRRQAVLWGSAAAMAAVFVRRRRSPVGAGLVLGGGLSNLWERLSAGRVYDYIRFPGAPGRLGRYVFNLADFAVFLGAAGLTRGGRRRRRHRRAGR